MWEIVLYLSPATVGGFLLLCAALPWAAAALQRRTRDAVALLARGCLLLCLLTVACATLLPDQALGSGGERFIIWMPGEGLWDTSASGLGVGDMERGMILRLQLANALMFVPLGMFLVLAGRRQRPGRAVAASLALSLVIEAAQYAMNAGRAVDIDDVLFNTLGAGLGVLLAHLPHRLLRPAVPPRHAHDPSHSGSMLRT
ncbi:VanZ family protein [Streptomyces sp. NPDC016845]|uniref:VanZ family protein n=1 Tax=Streptomyces sp. NPDC016845 TaxID=3364972 RepID=UPI0037BCF366